MDRRGGGDRRAGFKFHGMTTEELRRRREENQVEIRKAKREDTLNKRRNLVDVPTTPAPATSEASDFSYNQVSRENIIQTMKSS